MTLLSSYRDWIDGLAASSVLIDALSELLQTVKTDDELLLLKDVRLKDGKGEAVALLQESVAQLKYLSTKPTTALKMLGVNEPCSIVNLHELAWSEVASTLQNLGVSQDGNVCCGETLELSGPAGSGKTQLALGLTANFLSSNTAAKVVWVDTCNGFTAKRLKQILSRLPESTQTNALSRVTVEHVYGMESLLSLLENMCRVYEQRCQSEAVLLVVDSVSSLLSAVSTHVAQAEPTFRSLVIYLRYRLAMLARRFFASVLLVNDSFTPSFQAGSSAVTPNQPSDTKRALDSLWNETGAPKTVLWVDFASPRTMSPMRTASVCYSSFMVE